MTSMVEGIEGNLHCKPLVGIKGSLLCLRKPKERPIKAVNARDEVANLCMIKGGLDEPL